MRFLAGDFWCDCCDPSESHLSSLFFPFNLRLPSFFITLQKKDGKTHDIYFFGASNKWRFLFWTFTLGWFMVHGQLGSRSCFLSSLLFWWWSSWSCLPREFVCDRNTWTSVEHRCFTIIWGKWRWDHDMTMDMMAFLTVPKKNLSIVRNLKIHHFSAGNQEVHLTNPLVWCLKWLFWHGPPDMTSFQRLQ